VAKESENQSHKELYEHAYECTPIFGKAKVKENMKRKNFYRGKKLFFLKTRKKSPATSDGGFEFYI
jgi:hypothetical protein